MPPKPNWVKGTRTGKRIFKNLVMGSFTPGGASVEVRVTDASTSKYTLAFGESLSYEPTNDHIKVEIKPMGIKQMGKATLEPYKKTYDDYTLYVVEHPDRFALALVQKNAVPEEIKKHIGDAGRVIIGNNR
jgi:hypothetical protein